MDYTLLTTTLRDLLANLGAWLQLQQPRLLSAAALVAIGVLLALLLRGLASRVIRALGRMIPGQMLRRGLPQPTIERQVSDIVGLIVFWAVLLFFVAAAADALGLPVLSSSLAGLGFYVPRLLGAIIVVVVGMVLGNLARDAVAAAAAAAGAPLATAMGQAVRAAILTAAVLIAVAELGIDITLLTVVLAVTMAAVLGGFAIAFGLGASGAIGNIIGAHYLRQTLQPGQRIRIGEVDGTIAAITSTAVVLQVADGQVLIPARRFSETTSMLLTTRSAS
jgi:hypothetical protein